MDHGGADHQHHPTHVQEPSPFEHQYQHEPDVDVTHEAGKAEHQGSQHLAEYSMSPKDQTDGSQIHSPRSEPSTEMSDPEQQIALPPNWDVATNSEGEVYYYNVLTKETTWEMPTFGSSASFSETMTPSIEQGQDQSAEDTMDNNTDSHFSTNVASTLSNQSPYYVEVLSADPIDTADEDSLPEGWSSALGIHRKVPTGLLALTHPFCE
ncbi:MAG: hypothetical protein J3Q66DRAFT_54458 [Benniella sp.]|nr:MAG: hypothetical protein J3Q66DRAFT_54458 [Benniella sp.]